MIITAQLLQRNNNFDPFNENVGELFCGLTVLICSTSGLKVKTKQHEIFMPTVAGI